MVDLEKAIAEQGKDAPAPVAVAGFEEEEPLIPADLRVELIEGGAVARFAAKINSDLMNWLLYLYWLLLVASVMLLTNRILPDHGDDGTAVVPKDLLITPLAKFALLVCAVLLVLRTMKRMD